MHGSRMANTPTKQIRVSHTRLAMKDGHLNGKIDPLKDLEHKSYEQKEKNRAQAAGKQNRQAKPLRIKINPGQQNAPAHYNIKQ